MRKIRKKNKNRFFLYGAVICLCVMGVGYSVLTMNLNFQVTAKKKHMNFELGEIIYFNPETGKECIDYNDSNSTTGNTRGCMKWYVYDNSNADYVNVILDHNTTDIVAWNSSGDNTTMLEVKNALDNDTNTWVYGLNPRLIEASEIATVTKNTGWNSDTSVAVGSDFFYFDSNTTSESDTCKSSDLTGCKFGWLYDRIWLCQFSGCPNEEVGGSRFDGYWTSSKATVTNSSGNDQNNIWVVRNTGQLGTQSPEIAGTNGYGVRPVISISKPLP